MTEITRVFNVEKRSFTNVQRCYSGQQYDSVSTTLHFEYDPIDFLSEGYTPYIMFDVYDDDGNPLIYGPSSAPVFNGYEFPIPWDVTSRIKSQRVEYQLYFVSTGGFIYDEETQRYIEKENGTEYILSHKDGIAIKPSISAKRGRCGCPPPTMAPSTEPSIVGYINLWKEKGLIAPVKTELDEEGHYYLIFHTFNGDEYKVNLEIDLENINTLSEDLYVNNQVGGIPLYTTYPKGTHFETILRDMLYTEAPVVDLICKYGATTEVPQDYDSLTTDETMTWEDIKSSDGWDVTIVTGDLEQQVPQYPVVAVNSELTITNWYAKAMPFIDFVQTGNVLSVNKEDYTLYYLDTPTFDVDIGGTEYILKFKEA